jgi:hypothetical protein
MMSMTARGKRRFITSQFPSHDEHLTESVHQQNIAKAVASVNAIMAVLGVPPNERAFIDAVVALSQGRIEFQASDATIGREVFGNKRSKDAAKKWVQRARKSLIRWEESNNVTLIQAASGYKQEDQYFSTNYKIPLLEVAAKVLANPGRDVRQTARSALRGLGRSPAKVERARNRPRTDPTARRNREFQPKIRD